MKIKCTATSKTTGGPCGNYPADGAKVCRSHGGRAPQVKAAAARRVVEQQVTATLRGTPLREITNPLAELLALTSEVVAFKDHLRQLIEDLRELSNTDDKGVEQVHALVGAYERALDRTGTWLATVAKLNIDERMARVDEATQLLVIRAMEGALASIGLAGPQAVTARQAFARQLKAVA
jgi:hypothetical protein